MATEIKRTVKLSWSKGGAQIIAESIETLTQTGAQATENVQIIGGTSEAVSFGDVTAPAHLMFKNLNKKWSELTAAEKVTAGGVQATYEAANRVFVGTTSPTTSADAVYTIYPGSGVSFYQAITLAWYACKATDNVDLLVVAIEA
jgi:hypothetical protein